jgi:hypothetical protein
MAPIHIVKLRQNKTPLGSASISVSKVDPVVVNPDTDSKKASTKEGILPEIKKGRAPKSDTKIHPKDTMDKPSLPFILLFLQPTLVIIKPTTPTIIIDLIKADTSDCP